MSIPTLICENTYESETAKRQSEDLPGLRRRSRQDLPDARRCARAEGARNRRGTGVPGAKRTRRHYGTREGVRGDSAPARGLPGQPYGGDERSRNSEKASEGLYCGRSGAHQFTRFRTAAPLAGRAVDARDRDQRADHNERSRSGEPERPDMAADGLARARDRAGLDVPAGG